MIKNTTYFDNGVAHDTYKLKQRGMVKILVRKENKPHQLIIFNAITGKMLKPTER